MRRRRRRGEWRPWSATILAALGIHDPYAAFVTGIGMSVNDDPESTPEKSGKVGLLGRLRALLGLSGGSLREDVQEAIEEITEAPASPPLEREMLTNVLSLHEVRVADIMIPRADIIAVAHDAKLAEVLRRLPHRRPFAPACLCRKSRRPARHGAYPRSRRSHRQADGRLQAQRATAGPARLQTRLPSRNPASCGPSSSRRRRCRRSTCS